MSACWGSCWGSLSSNSTPGTTGQISSVISSHQTGSTVSTGINNFSNSSQFSAASGDEVSSSGQILPTPNMRIFTFAELKIATRNFRSDTVLGEGGFGKVYKGWLDERIASNTGTGSVIAVKKLSSESMQGLEEWRAEVNFLGRLSHPNLVRLLGFCVEEKELLLVYEFMQKGSLENHLFGRGQPLPWETRMKIVIGAARGLTFLHTSEKKIIYRDFKASNILLDGSYTAKISDFGLARMGPSASQSHVSTRVIGTYGYAAPEYVTTGHLYLKSDVYGFGVVLAEVLTGLRALDPSRPTEQQNLTEWIQPYLSDRRKLKKVMDAKLEWKYPTRAAELTAQLVLKCIASEQKARPSMKEVVEVLERINGISEIPRERRSRTGHNVAHRRGQQSMPRRSPINPQHDMHRIPGDIGLTGGVAKGS